MEKDVFHFEIITPARSVVSDDIESFEAPGVVGEFQVLAGHTPFLTGLKIGRVTYVKDGKKTHLSISGGFCEVKQDSAVILALTAESSGEIDRERSDDARKRAQQRLKSKEESIDFARAQAALDRALNRLHVVEM